MPARILLVDDSREIHALVRAHLGADGIEVHSAYDGARGLSLARELRPDLILLDVSMPEMDGYEACELLGLQPETELIPIVFLSAAADAADKSRGLNQGASDYIGKPFSGDELRARVRVWLRHKFRLEQESRRATRDALTGLGNRAEFDDRLEAETAAAARHGRPLACVMADIDRFKSINDTYGHPFGDRAIRQVAELLRQQCRREDVVCRYGGEEFVVLCPGLGAESAAALAERLRAALASGPIDGPSGPVTITCSFGVADGGGTGGCAGGGAMVAAADRALYRAKQTGRNRVCIAASAAAA